MRTHAIIIPATNQVSKLPGTIQEIESCGKKAKILQTGTKEDLDEWYGADGRLVVRLQRGQGNYKLERALVLHAKGLRFPMVLEFAKETQGRCASHPKLCLVAWLL